MTVGELKRALSIYPDGYSVVMSRDEEGNQMHKLDDDLSTGHWNPSTLELDDSDSDAELPEDCVVLWPREEA
jgi:hypothetical protein